MLFIFIVNVVITMGLIIIFISLFIVLQTVKYFNNEGYETDHYDKYLKSK
jgi:ABC-type transport system involved in Fe-S cluster assembly fused permease/ATPase subunit